MARPFGAKEAKILAEEHRTLLSRLEAEQAAAPSYRENIRQYSDQLVAQSVLSVLRDVPVEELGADLDFSDDYEDDTEEDE